MTLDPALLLAAERAVDAGPALLRRSRRQVGAIVSKGDRDYATEVDFRIEETIRAALREVARRESRSSGRRRERSTTER